MQQRLTPEMELVLACCRWPPSPARAAAVATAAARVDWPRALALVERHRVQGLVRRALGEAGVEPPGPERDALDAQARRVATQNLQLAAESLRLVRRLAGVGSPALIVKGTPLAMLAYGTLATKMGWDIDLLVPADRLAGSAAVLGGAGYVCVLPGPDGGMKGLAAWHRFSKESVWKHAVSGVHVELHTALVDSPMVLPGIDARTPARSVEISRGLHLPTLPPDPLFAYLCVHGAASGWRRAKWLADVGALLAACAPEEIEALYMASQRLGAGRAAGQALLLCHHHLGTAVPASLLARLRRDRGTRLLAALAGRMMTAPDGFDSPEETRWGTLPIHLMQFLLLPGWRYKRAELRRRFVPDPRAPRAGWYPLRLIGRRLRRKAG